MHCFCLPEAFPGHVRRTVLPISAQPSVPTLLLSYKNRLRLSPLESTLPGRPVSGHSKRLTSPRFPLESTLTKKTGGGAPLPPPKVCQLVTTPRQHKPGTTVTLTPTLSPIVSSASAQFPSHRGGGWTRPQNLRPTKRKVRALRATQSPVLKIPARREDHGSPKKRLIEWHKNTAQPPVWPVAVNQEK